MNLVILGIFSFNIVGLEGAILQSLSHGFVASALFLLIGVVYDRYRTRIIYYYGGLATVMPIYVTIFLFFTMANISFVRYFALLYLLLIVNQTSYRYGCSSLDLGVFEKNITELSMPRKSGRFGSLCR